MSLPSRQIRTPIIIFFALAFNLVLVVLALAIRGERYEMQIIESPQVEAGAWALEISPEQAQFDRIKPDPDAQRIFSLARGRPPVEGVRIDVPDGRRDWFWDQRSYPLETIPPAANTKALQQARSQIAGQSLAQSWQSLGPSPIKQGSLGISSCTQSGCDTWRADLSGRTKAIVFHPNNDNILYVATATAGIWKSSDGGNSFTPLTDDQPIMATHSLAIDPNNPNTQYRKSRQVNPYFTGNSSFRLPPPG
ncbi:MAG: hypothetical protein GY759_19820 [Chloroflexi bacterium]|nr:hypothetical protein [Chloroflexota bacterium]